MECEKLTNKECAYNIAKEIIYTRKLINEVRMCMRICNTAGKVNG